MAFVQGLHSFFQVPSILSRRTLHKSTIKLYSVQSNVKSGCFNSIVGSRIVTDVQSMTTSSCFTYKSQSNRLSFSTSTFTMGRYLQLAKDKYEDHQTEPRVNTDHIITVPIHLKQRLEKKILRESTKGHRMQKIKNASREGKKTQVVIQARKPESNHYFSQTYPKGSEIPLISKGWLHRKAAGDWFTIRPASKSSEYGFSVGSTFTFEDLGVNSILVQKLHENKALKPTHIQELAIPKILNGTNNLIAAETGCGKTLAYLVPLVQQIILDKRGRQKRSVNQPLVVILVPSRELADQIHYVASKLTEGLEIHVSLLQGGNLSSKITSPPTSYVDLLISTVNAASVLTTAGIYNTKKVEHVILDEADTLLDDSFADDVVGFLRKFAFHSTSDNVQLTLVSATLPRTVESILEDVIPMESLNRISTPALHRIMPHIPQTFLRLKKIDKPVKILELVKSDVENKIPVMIFCNKVPTCDWMMINLIQNGINCIKVHGETRPHHRKGLLNKYHNGEVDVLICTDLGSRGINTIRTGHVINYDFPLFMADYIHRCGRTGRIGSERFGKISNFICGRLEIEIVQEIERSIRKELPLAKVDANIKRLISSRYGMFKPIQSQDEEQE